MLRPRRKVFEVTWDDDFGAWFVRRRSRPRTVLATTRVKDDAIERGAAIARAASLGGRRAQLVVRNMDGTFSFERTYPRLSDPPRWPS